MFLGLRVRAIVIQCVSCFNDHFKHSTLVFYNMSQHLHYPAPGHGPYHQDSLLCIEMMGNGVSRTLLGRVGKAIIYNLFLLWIMDEPIWANMDICSRHQQRANTKVLKYLSVHLGRGECGGTFVGGYLVS